MKTINKIEAEGGELVLRNSAGDIIIVPKKYRQEVQDMVKEGCFGCIDNLASTLPVMDEYAEDGTLIPEWPPYKKRIIPPFPPQQTYQDVVNPQLISETPQPAATIVGKKDPNAPNIHILVESPTRKWNEGESFMADQSEYHNWLAKKMLGKTEEQYLNENGWGQDIEEYHNEMENIKNYNEYRKSKGLPEVPEEYIDQYFMQSANRIKNNLPNVNIIQTYKEPEKLDSVFQSVRPNDKIVIMGHSGGHLLGLANVAIARQINRNIKDKTGVECLLGSCNSSELLDQYKEAGIPVSGFNRGAWYVPYDKGDDLYDMMFGWDYKFSEDKKRSVVKSPLDKTMTRMYDR